MRVATKGRTTTGLVIDHPDPDPGRQIGFPGDVRRGLPRLETVEGHVWLGYELERTEPDAPARGRPRYNVGTITGKKLNTDRTLYCRSSVVSRSLH